MKTITKTFPVFSFSELSEKAKQRAKDDDAQVMGYAWAEEAKKSLFALAEHFGGKNTDYDLDYFGGSHSSCSFDMPELDKVEITQKLAELGTFNPDTLKGHGDCVLTGYSSDEDAIDGFRIAFYGGEQDLSKLMQSAFRSWLKAAQADCEDQYSDGTFGENCDANNLLFTEDGELFTE